MSRKTVTLGLVFAAVLCAQSDNPAWCSAPPPPELAALTKVPTSQTWFDVYTVAPGVFAISEPRQSQHTISYLIVGNSQALLFDTGMGIGDLRSAVSDLTKLPVTVLNSHTHHDHVGSNWQFATILGMDTAFTRTNAQGSRDRAQADIAPGQYCNPLPPGFTPANYETKPWKISATRRDGDRIELGGHSLEILACPGHTPDAVCLLDRARGLIFTGDTYYKGTIWLFRDETDLEAYGHTVQRLAALAPGLKIVLGAHNVPAVPATILPALAESFSALRSGKGERLPGSGDRVRYRSGAITFLLHAIP